MSETQVDSCYIPSESRALAIYFIQWTHCLVSWCLSRGSLSGFSLFASSKEPTHSPLYRKYFQLDSISQWGLTDCKNCYLFLKNFRNCRFGFQPRNRLYYWRVFPKADATWPWCCLNCFMLLARNRVKYIGMWFGDSEDLSSMAHNDTCH